MEKSELTALVVRAQSGDQAAMEEVLRAAHASVSYQCRKLLRDPRGAEDMTQEVLLIVYTRLNTLKTPEAFWGWLNQTTANRCVNAMQRNHVEFQFAEDEEGHSVLDSLEDLDEQQVPDRALDNAETTRMIEEIVDSLPDAQRVCTLMYYYDEMSVKEIAAALGVSENTVKSRLNYARKAVKERVLDYEKKGVKLYGLSPLPFMLFFLLRAAGESADSAKAAAAAKQVMEMGAAAAGGAAAGAAATGGGAAAAGGSAAGGTAAAGGLSAKLIAGVLAGLLLVGGAVAAVVNSTQSTNKQGSAFWDALHTRDETGPVETESSETAPNGYSPDPRWADLQPGQTAIQFDDVYIQSGMTLREVAEAMEGSGLSFSLDWETPISLDDEFQSWGAQRYGRDKYGWDTTPISLDVYYNNQRAFTVCYLAGLPLAEGEAYLRGDCPVFSVQPSRDAISSVREHILTRVGTMEEFLSLNLKDFDQFVATFFSDDIILDEQSLGRDGRDIVSYDITERYRFSWNGYTVYHDGEPGIPILTRLKFYEDTGEMYTSGWELDRPWEYVFVQINNTRWMAAE